MKFQTSIWMQAEVKTPVFIWDGDSVPPLSCVVEGSVLHVVDSRRFFGALTPQEQQAYLSWIDPILRRLDELDSQIQRAREGDERALKQQRRQEEARLSLRYFLEQRLRTNPVAFIKERRCVAYSLRCQAQPGTGGFRTFIKEAGYRPYVPGTELKGALRTALLLYLVDQQGGYGRLRRELLKFREIFSSASERERRACLSHLSEIALQLEGRLLRGSRNDAQYDLLKLIQVSDGELLTPDSLCLYALESAGTTRPTRTFAEGLREGTTFSFRLAIASIEEIQWALQELGLVQKARDHLTPGDLLEAIHHRSACLLEEDKKYFQDLPYMVKRIEQLAGENRPHAPLLRLGTGQGFLSVTVDLPVRQQDPQLYDEAIRAGVSWKRRWRTKKGNFPSTRRVVTDGKGNPLTLPGYIQLSITS